MTARRIMTTLAVTAAVGVAFTTPAAQAAPAAPRTAQDQHDYNGDGYGDLAVGAARASVDGKAAAGYVGIVYGSATGLNTSAKQMLTQDSPGVPGSVGQSHYFGFALNSGDFNDDGYSDLAAASAGEPNETTIVWGSKQGLAGGAVLKGAGSGESRRTGDFNGDGHQDILVGGFYGYANVLFGPIAADGTAAFSRAITVVDPENYGRADVYDAGDLDGDGITDLSLQTSNWEADTETASFTWLKGTTSGVFAQPVRVVPGGNPGKGTTQAVGDFNRDGFDDVAIGRQDGYDQEDPTRSTGGSVTVIPGSATGPDRTRTTLIDQDTPGVPGVGEGSFSTSDEFGSVMSTGDLNGDGYADLAVGMPLEDHHGLMNAGAFVTLNGSARGLTGTGAKAFSQDTAGVPGAAERGDRFGRTIKIVNSKGFGRGVPAELAVGAPDENAEAGVVWAFRTNTTGVIPAGSFSFGADTFGATVPNARFGQAFSK